MSERAYGAAALVVWAVQITHVRTCVQVDLQKSSSGVRFGKRRKRGRGSHQPSLAVADALVLPAPSVMFGAKASDLAKPSVWQITTRF
jgi:hypothetical protein